TNLESEWVSNEQFGFVESRSTIDPLDKLITIVENDEKSKRYTLSLLFYIKGAFDIAWYPGISYKLVEKGYDLSLIKIRPRLMSSYVLLKAIPLSYVVSYGIRASRMPHSVSFERIIDGTGIANTLQSNRAVYHSACVNKFDNRQVSRELEKQSEAIYDNNALDSRCRTPRGKHCNVFTTCLFCDKVDDCDRLHDVETDIGGLIKERALLLNDDKLLVKLTNTDLVATEAKCHKICHTKSYNRLRKTKKDNFIAKTDQNSKLHRVSAQSIAFASVLAVIEDSRDNDEEIIMFKLSDLSAIYNARLNSFGIEGSVNVSKLKTRLLHNIPGLTSVKRGRNVARILRDKMFQNCAFTGSFEDSSQHSACPSTLLALIHLLVDGPPHQGSQGSEITSQAAKTITQLLVYNAVSRMRPINRDTGEVVNARQRKNQETPTAVYVALLIHAHTRQKKLIEKVHSLGNEEQTERFVQQRIQYAQKFNGQTNSAQIWYGKIMAELGIEGLKWEQLKTKDILAALRCHPRFYAEKYCHETYKFNVIKPARHAATTKMVKVEGTAVDLRRPIKEKRVVSPEQGMELLVYTPNMSGNEPKLLDPEAGPCTSSKNSGGKAPPSPPRYASMPSSSTSSEGLRESPGPSASNKNARKKNLPRKKTPTFQDQLLSEFRQSNKVFKTACEAYQTNSSAMHGLLERLIQTSEKKADQ
ncbi:hypothetical protein QYM36_005284, partial [Artemia franciscana]